MCDGENEFSGSFSRDSSQQQCTREISQCCLLISYSKTASQREREWREDFSNCINILLHTISWKHLQLFFAPPHINTANWYIYKSSAVQIHTKKRKHGEGSIHETLCYHKDCVCCRIFAFHQLWIQWRHIYKINMLFWISIRFRHWLDDRGKTWPTDG